MADKCNIANKGANSSQMVYSKNCIIEADKNKTFPKCNNLLDNAAGPVGQKPATNISCTVNVNDTSNAASQHLNTNKSQESDIEESENNGSSTTQKKKNARKKEQRKLHLQLPVNEQKLNSSISQASYSQGQSQSDSMQAHFAQGQAHAAPVQARYAPVQSYSAPVQAHFTPMQARSAPMHMHSAPVQANYAPVRNNYATCQTKSGPTEANCTSAQASSASAQTNYAPAQAKTHQQRAPPQAGDCIASILQNERPPVQEFFKKFVTPMYAPTNFKHWVNVKQHSVSRFEDMAHRQSGSVPSSPGFIPGHQFHSGSFPNSPHILEPNSPRYLQNALQHPLLSQSVSTAIYNNFNPPQFNLMRNFWIPYMPNHVLLDQASALSPQNKMRKGKKAEGLVTFEPYLTMDVVEAGLKDNSLIEGVIRINPKQYLHAYISNVDRSEQDIFIDGLRNRNRALEGDVVVVQLINDSETEDNEIKNKMDNNNEVKNKTENNNETKNGTKQEDETNNKTEDNNDTKNGTEKKDETNSKTEENNENKNRKGKVVYIKEKVHRRTCIGILKLMLDKNRQRALFIPRDSRVPRLNIPFTSWPNNFYNEADKYENVLFLALIEEWTISKCAIGKILSQIGLSGDMEVERRAILAETDLDVTPYGSEYRHLYPRLDYTVPEAEIKKRLDCRNMCIFSIDPFNCRDIDDAMSCRKLQNGNYEVGVHISDVTHFLSEHTKLDEKVAEKATTIYLVDKAYHMLPDELCMLCSLFPGVDKLAFSVFWEMTEDAKVISHKFAKTIIKSCCQLAYEHAQDVLDGKQDAADSFPEFYNGFKYNDVYETIKILGKLSSILRKKRFETGAIRIDQPKLQFTLRPTDGMPESYEIYQSKKSHQLIEEFMLLANMTVAKRIIKDHPKLAFLRCHPPPSSYMMRQLASALKPVGIDIDVSSAGDLYRSVSQYVGPDNTDKGRAMVLSMLCAKPMTRAKYFCAGDEENDDFHHYALNVSLYTHFTSPIRRYADIMVHRLLSASLNYRDVPQWEVNYVKQVAFQCNKQKYNAKRAGELSTEVYILKYIEMHSPMITEAAVVEIREKYIDFIILEMGLNRRMFFSNDFPGKYERIKSEAGSKLAKMEVTWNATKEVPSIKQVIEVFSLVKVEMFREDIAKVGMRLVRPQ